MSDEIGKHIDEHSYTITNSWIEELLNRLETSDNTVLTVRQWLKSPVPLEHWPGYDKISGDLCVMGGLGAESEVEPDGQRD